MKSLMNSRLILGVSLVLASFGLSSGAVAQGLPKADLTVERMYQYPLIQGRSPSAPSMAPDGHKVAFGWNTFIKAHRSGPLMTNSIKMICLFVKIPYLRNSI